MCRKITAKERIVGFYSTGPSIRSNDLRIYDIVQQQLLPSAALSPPVFLIIDIRPDRPDLPVTAYKVVEQQQQQQAKSGTPSVKRTFAHLPVQMGALEAEEIGVEHLLRDIHDPTVSTVASLVKGKITGLATLASKLVECKDYLQEAAASNTPPNPVIVANLQTILNLMPNLETEELIRSMMVKTNDMHMAIYLASLIRSVIALHNLVSNKIRYGEDGTEYKEEEEKKEEDDKKESENDKKKKNGGSDKKDTKANKK